MAASLHRSAAAILTVLILGFPGAGFSGTRKEAEVIIRQKDGSTFAGELIAVRPDALLLLSPSGKDESVDLTSVKTVRVVRRSRAGSGFLTGFLIGAVAGAVMGGLWEGSEPEYSGSTFQGIVAFGGIGGLIGLAAGSVGVEDKIISLEGLSGVDRAKALDYLRTKARLRNPA